MYIEWRAILIYGEKYNVYSVLYNISIDLYVRVHVDLDITI